MASDTSQQTYLKSDLTHSDSSPGHQLPEEEPSSLESESIIASSHPGRRWLVRGIVLFLILATLGTISTQLIGTLIPKQSNSMLTHTVKRDDLLITITENGSLESASNTDIKCEVAGGSTILWIVEDGKLVKKGDEIVRLDAATLEDQINTQKIAYQKARAAKIQAEKDYNVAVKGVEEYVNGTYIKEMKMILSNITVAEENLRSVQNTLEHTRRMFRKGYVSSLELESKGFAVQSSRLQLELYQTDKEVLEKYTRAKTLEELTSLRDTSDAKKLSETASFDLEEARLKRFEAQLSKCVVLAPSNGMVIYANNESRRGGQEAQVEEGAIVREQQTLIRLPDLSTMQVKVNVHESKVDQVEPGMRARIRIQDAEYQGVVISIANQPERSGWWSGDVKKYATTVGLEGQHDLKPGMTAEVEILIDHVKDTPTLPVVAVVEQQGEYFCWVKNGEATERRKLIIGPSDDKFIVILDGVAAGDEVVLNPRAMIEEAREDTFEPEKVNVNEQFGERTASPRTEGPNRGKNSRSDRKKGGTSDLMKRLDKDRDGKISKQEAPERMKSRFDELDKNKDGSLDAAEIKAMGARGKRPQGTGPGRPN